MGDNIKIGLRQAGREVVDCIHLAHDVEQWQAVVNTVMDLRGA
jgi:hypothetical protein